MTTGAKGLTSPGADGTDRLAADLDIPAPCLRAEQHLVIVKGRESGRYSVYLDEQPETMSDFRIGSEPADVIATMPLAIALAGARQASAKPAKAGGAA